MSVQISRILHAGYVFRCEDVEIFVDPIFENPFSHNCYAFPDVRFDIAAIRQLRPAAVFLSHYHDDHCSLDSLNLLPRETPMYLYCVHEELFAMLRQLGFADVNALRIDAPVAVGPFVVTPREALESDVDSMLQVQAGGMNILNVVDAWIAPSTVRALAKQHWDMVLWPFQTMRETEVLSPSRMRESETALPEHFVEQITQLNPRFIVPSSCQFVQESWSWYQHAMFPISYAQFAQAMPLPVVRLDPSVSILLDEHGAHGAQPLPWVMPVGEQDVDYDFRPDLAPPSTADVARHFPVSEDDRARVMRYCAHELMAAYEGIDDSYFDAMRVWRLSLYDDRGQATHFHYRLDGETIALVDAQPFAWLTEVPMAKLVAALERGESLTSMYLRINDMQFDAQTERDLQTAELMEDPLVRTLFKGSVCAYQAAQLRRLKKEKPQNR